MHEILVKAIKVIDIQLFWYPPRGEKKKRKKKKKLSSRTTMITWKTDAGDGNYGSFVLLLWQGVCLVVYI